LFSRTTKNRLADPSEICALEFKGEFRRFGICSVSATIGTDRSNFKFCGESGIIGLAEKRPSAMIDEALAKLDPLPPASRGAHKMAIAGTAIRRLQTKTAHALLSHIFISCR
jgi:hypothetical protein